MANSQIKLTKDKFAPAIIDSSLGEAIDKPSLNA